MNEELKGDKIRMPLYQLKEILNMTKDNFNRALKKSEEEMREYEDMVSKYETGVSGFFRRVLDKDGYESSLGFLETQKKYVKELKFEVKPKLEELEKEILTAVGVR